MWLNKLDIIPAIDIKDGKCVRLFQGNYSKEKVFGDDLIEIASKWIDMGAKRLHIVDLDGAKDGSQKNISILKKLIKFSNIPIQIGGGVRKFSDAKYLFELGVDKIIFGTSAVKNPDEIKSTIEKYSSKFVIVGIDAKNGMVQTNGWLIESQISSNILLKKMIGIGVEQFIYTDITRDGTLSEPNYEQIIEILENFKVKLTVAGGVATIEHLMKLKSIGAYSAISGMALYEGKINLREAIKKLL
ncbi:MAG: 1-(5-phosphoribosyl)-5-[(5-phosphoribosylamino)methylideneamino]imidazole-4-carboxamide isomerase [Chloroflexi bacterium]|nr:1-(5-phosphoribosyl)-5-[(5-phosphoribosylamino)methylideneamino]imidazole-4-carboxamide isomerase [Chloroflexota bacterium]